MMATVEQQLGARLREDRVLRIPIRNDPSRFGDMTYAEKAAVERMGRIVRWAKCKAEIQVEGTEVVATVQ